MEAYHLSWGSHPAWTHGSWSRLFQDARQARLYWWHSGFWCWWSTIVASVKLLWPNLISPRLADITLLSQDLGTFRAHKVVLSASSRQATEFGTFCLFNICLVALNLICLYLCRLFERLLTEHGSPSLFLRGVSHQILLLLMRLVEEEHVCLKTFYNF